jgi:phosphoenolpyruvate---glycerone phosphotransferase subunit DhaL
MEIKISSKDYIDYIKLVADIIAADKDYITELDAAIGDGDHWTNMNKGFQALIDMEETLAGLPISEMFKSIGMKLMSSVGGSAGILYGSAYLAAAKTSVNIDFLDLNSLFVVLEAMGNEIMNRGKAEIGHKTMVDAIAPAINAYREALDRGDTLDKLANAVKEAAIEGANDTINMAATKGRAYYQENKGVGHLDPGAVTMSYQIATLMDFLNSIQGN